MPSQVSWLDGMGGVLSAIRELRYNAVTDSLLVAPIEEYEKLRVLPALVSVSKVPLSPSGQVLAVNSTAATDVIASFTLPGGLQSHFGMQLLGETGAVVTVNMSLASVSSESGALSVSVLITQVPALLNEPLHLCRSFDSLFFEKVGFKKKETYSSDSSWRTHAMATARARH